MGSPNYKIWPTDVASNASESGQNAKDTSTEAGLSVGYDVYRGTEQQSEHE